MRKKALTEPRQIPSNSSGKALWKISNTPTRPSGRLRPKRADISHFKKGRFDKIGSSALMDLLVNSVHIEDQNLTYQMKLVLAWLVLVGEITQPLAQSRLDVWRLSERIREIQGETGRCEKIVSISKGWHGKFRTYSISMEDTVWMEISGRVKP